MFLESPVHGPLCLSIPGLLGYSDNPRCFWDKLCKDTSVWVSQDSQDTQTIPGCFWNHLCKDPSVWVSQDPGILRRSQDVSRTICAITLLSEYPRIPGILRWSQDVPGITCAGTPSVLVPPGFLGYSDDPRMFPGPPVQRPLCLSIPGFPRYSDDSRMFVGPPVQRPLCLSIPGFLGFSNDPRMFLGSPMIPGCS